MTGSRVQSRRVGVTVCQLAMHTGVRGNSKLAEMIENGSIFYCAW